MKQAYQNGGSFPRKIMQDGEIVKVKNKKFTKEYKSPHESRFKMASFTELVKNKPKLK